MTLIHDTDLRQVLTDGDPDDLSILADFITDKGTGRISLSADVCSTLHKASLAREFSMEARAYIAEEVQRFGGNSVMNLLRGGAGVPYKELVCDVADHVKASYEKTDDCIDIETAILARVLEQSMKSMTDEQRKEIFDAFGERYVGAGPVAMAALIAAMTVSVSGRYRLAALVANASVTALLGRGLSTGAAGTALRGAGVLAGPLGWAITAIWTVFDLASPAYRVTVPCVIQIAYMRQKAVAPALMPPDSEAQASTCTQCNAVLVTGAKFCSQCGQRVAILALPT